MEIAEYILAHRQRANTRGMKIIRKTGLNTYTTMPVTPRSHIAVLERGSDPDRRKPNTAAYLQCRQELIASEGALRFDAQQRATRSQVEKNADQVIKRLRDAEIRDVYDAPGKVSVMKGSTWTRAKSRGVEGGRLYEIMRRLPKGALLHCHFDATVDAGWLIAESRRETHLFVRAASPLTSHPSLYSTPIVFRLLPEEPGTEADGGFKRATEPLNDLYSSSYVPNTWVRLSHARNTFPYEDIYVETVDGFESVLNDFHSRLAQVDDAKSPNAAAFDAFLLSKMTFTPVPTHLRPPIVTSREAWEFFAETFAITEGLQTHRTRFAYFVRSFELAVEDNISYVEPRVNFFQKLFTGSDGQASLTHVDLVELFEKALDTVKAKLPAGKTFDAKIIYSTLRFIDAEQLQWYIDDAIDLKKRFPDRIVAFDLVGHEDHGITLHDYAPSLLAMQHRLRELEIDLPFAFHAGETLGDGDPIDANLYDAILLGTKRIGHAFSLARHPRLVELVKERAICIESCPISNQVLRYTDSLAVHPVLTLLAYGCPVALSNDDPCQFLNLGLSPDFYSILIASDHFDLTSLAVLARNSLQHSLIPDQDQKQTLLSQWQREWDAVIQSIASMDI
jgi:adenosine deaminase CECR1